MRLHEGHVKPGSAIAPLGPGGPGCKFRWCRYAELRRCCRPEPSVASRDATDEGCSLKADDAAERSQPEMTLRERDYSRIGSRCRTSLKLAPRRGKILFLSFRIRGGAVLAARRKPLIWAGRGLGDRTMRRYEQAPRRGAAGTSGRRHVDNGREGSCVPNAISKTRSSASTASSQCSKGTLARRIRLGVHGAYREH
jgi:hypothetical protein